jgi:uncharacterized integral membrane protein
VRSPTVRGVADDRSRRGLPFDGRLVGLVLAAVALVAFVVQNTEDVRVNWLMIEVTLPLWLALLITAILGAIVANLASWALRRRAG